MLNEIINNVNLNKYITSFHLGKTIFHEGDSSKDLYILVSGHLDILKGSTKITEITEKGSFFGEMSFLLGTKRTATARAKDDVEAICIPKEEITTFLHEFPDIANEMTKLLAKRLDETSQTLYRLKEFCDQLPDAVIATDKQGKIITWNFAAEKLYGRVWNQMKGRSLEEIYEEPGAYRKYIEEVKNRYSVRERILKVRHPQKGARFISTSTNLLYDDHKSFQGILSLGRDVTSVHDLEKKYKRTHYRFFVTLVILLGLAISVFWGHSWLTTVRHPMHTIKQSLQSQLNEDYLFLRSKLVDHLSAGDRFNSNKVIQEYLEKRRHIGFPYTGLVLLKQDKMVLSLYSYKEGVLAMQKIENSYNGLELQGNQESIHQVLTLYRAHKDHPMGEKSLEIVFPINLQNNLLGWLIFKMDPDHLDKYGIDESIIQKFRF